MGLPRIVPGSKLNVFKFYGNRAISEAVIYEGAILKLAMAVTSERRKDAYQCAYRLSQEYVTLMSPDAALCRVWVDIRCPEDFRLASKLNSP